MKIHAKFLPGLCAVLIGGGVFAVVQERKAHAAVEGVRASLAVGDSKEKVERVMLAHGLQPEIGDGGRAYVAHVWFPFRHDVSVIVVLNGHWEVGLVSIKDRS